MTTLSCEGLCYTAPDGAALVRDVSLSIEQGDRLAIVGPNGAGKTTLLRMLAGTLRPSAGQTLLDGRDMAGLKPMQRARSIAIVGQTDTPDARVLLWDYVGLGRIPHSGALSRAEEWKVLRDALQQTGLLPMRDRPLGTLSGGEMQRAQIARALAQEPVLLFLDEPTNHLDPRARGNLLGLVAELGLTVVAVLHDLALVPEFATKIAVMNRGSLAAIGKSDAALSAQTVASVFGIGVLRLPHPHDGRELTVFDIPIKSKGISP